VPRSQTIDIFIIVIHSQSFSLFTGRADDKKKKKKERKKEKERKAKSVLFLFYIFLFGLSETSQSCMEFDTKNQRLLLCVVSQAVLLGPAFL